MTNNQGGNDKGHRNKQTKARNEARRRFRREYPEHRGKQLKKIPIEANLTNIG